MGVSKTEKIHAYDLVDLVDEAPRELPKAVLLMAYDRDNLIVRRLAEGESIVVGRTDERGALTLSAPDLSFRHAEIRNEDGSVLLQDLRSSNGTWIHGKRVEGERELFLGDEAKLGSVTIAVRGDAKERSARYPISHERFRCAIEDEIARARRYEKTFSLAVVRGLPSGGRGYPHVSHFLDRVLGAASEIDRVTLFGTDTVMMLLPEQPPKDAGESLSLLASGDPRLDVTIVSYPDSGADADALLARLYKARLSPPEPQQAPSRSERALAEPASSSAPMKRALEQASRVAESDLPILILGETGAGKEVLAKTIHERSRRRGRFVPVNCGAIPSTLVEATLFGHKRGAFTDAKEAAIGVFIAAHKGTLFLDEIGELPKPAQAALLRALETKKVTPVGSNDEIAADARVIAATHCDLDAMVEAGTFRRDLYFRLNASMITVPSLRERPEDIEPLAKHFLQVARRANKKSVRSIEPEALEVLLAYAWPGNVRELKNAIDLAVVLSVGDMIQRDDLPERVRGTLPSRPSHRSLPEALKELELAMIVSALRSSKDNEDAAKKLGIPVRTLLYRMKRLDLTRRSHRD